MFVQLNSVTTLEKGGGSENKLNALCVRDSKDNRPSAVRRRASIRSKGMYECDGTQTLKKRWRSTSPPRSSISSCEPPSRRSAPSARVGRARRRTPAQLRRSLWRSALGPLHTKPQAQVSLSLCYEVAVLGPQDQSLTIDMVSDGEDFHVLLCGLGGRSV